MNTIEFNQETHQYFIDGVEFPSVTTILKPIQNFGMVAPDVLARAAEFGRNVHTATEYYDRGTLDEDTLHEALVPYLNGWKKFLAEKPMKFHLNEFKVFSLKYGYAGTLDRVGLFIVDGKVVLIDIKTGMETRSFGPQTAAYASAVEEMLGLKVHKRFTVRLLPNDYRLIPHKSKNDFNIFKCCLGVYKFNQNFKG